MSLSPILPSMNIGVIFGSRSTEHEVSVASAFGVMQGLIKHTDHQIFPLYITKKGQWIYEPDFLQKEKISSLISKDYSQTEFSIDFSQIGRLTATQKSKSFLGKKSDISLDILFLVLHGKNGEDGAVQGILQMLDVPYVSPSVIGSAIGMNKVMMKDVLKANDIPVVDYKSYFQGNESIAEIEKLGYPLFIKPANLGSSIGISRVTTKNELQQAIEVAFHYDNQIICEKGVSSLVELNCSIMIQNEKVIPSLIEKISSQSHFLSFDEKYINDGGTMQGIESKVEIPAQIPSHIEKQILELCQKVAQALQIDGGAPRIDFMRDQEQDKVYVNEINTIPGAMQIHLWSAGNVELKDFFSTLIQTALFRHQKMKEKNAEFSSSVLDLTLNFKK